MSLNRLQIKHVRNLSSVNLDGLARVNVLFGANGSGKTSVLEAIHLLGMARSFRGNSVKSLITHKEVGCVVFGQVSLPGQQHGSGVPLGVQRNLAGEAQLKVGGKIVRSVAELVHHLPIQVINADSFQLLTGAPGARRQYLDWGVFHVEQRFLAQWQRFQRCIKQRNNLLRHGKIADQELAVWTRDLAIAGNAIHEYREAYFKLLKPSFKDIMTRLAPTLEGLELSYRRGWDKQLPYEEALQGSQATDIDQGYTHVGPQRADIRVTIAGHVAADTLSRGQQKLVVCGLKLAQGQLMAEHGGGDCTYLVDDLPSELDEVHCRLVCELLASMSAQVFITCVDREGIDRVWPVGGSEMAMFHVEQGEINRSTVSGG